MASNGIEGTNHIPSNENLSKQDGNRPIRGKDSWIYSTFKRRTCSQFIPSKKEIRRCCCGRLDNDHQPEAVRHIPSSEVTWDVNRHTVAEPTDAYGELEFTGAGQTSRAKFIRISHDTDPEKVLRLLTQEWRLELPKLLISVTGGAKSFLLHPKLKNVLRQGLLKAAQTTGAWIITGGTNTGVMRHVGEAVKGHTVMSRGAPLLKDKASQLHLIGIATWGIVDHKSDLINSKGVVTYHMTSSLLSEGACLDNNHTHFILVDDGREGKYGGEIPFRASLQNCITTKKISRNKSHGIPVVLLVLEGGPNTILTVLESVTSNPAVPVVIAEGSGRAADILAHAHSLIISNDGTDMEDMAEVVEHQQLLMKIQKAFPECNEEKCISVYHDVLKCVGNKRYITIFRMDEDGIDIDRAILRALLKAQRASAADQLSLALIWNRADIARTEIFTEDQKWEMDALEDAMMDALANNRVEFVNLLLENGVSMSRFLTTTRLEELYKARKRSSASVVFRQIIGKDKIESGFTLADVKSAIRRLLGGTYKGHGKDYSTIKRALDMANMKMFVDGHHDHMSHSIHVTNSYKELLLWSVLCNMQKMALFMWERGDENLARALVAGKLYNNMARLTERDDAKADVTDELYAHVEEFKRLALGLLDQCFRTNEELAQQLLTYNLENWGGQTCLSLAVAIEHEEFLAHCSCQTLLTDIWTGAMKSAHRSSIKTMLGILFPPTIFLLEFKTKRELLSMPVTLEEHEQDLAEEQEEAETQEENQALRSSRAMTEENGGLELSKVTSVFFLDRQYPLMQSAFAEMDTVGARPWFQPSTWVSSVAGIGFVSASESDFLYIEVSVKKEMTAYTGAAGSLGLLLAPISLLPTETEIQETRVVHLRWGKKILEFYKAPVTKFWSNVFAYLVFLALFSYVILIRQNKIPSISEIVLIIFVCTLCTEEIRQILHSEPPTLKNKFKEWASSKWNLLDGFAVVSFFVGLGLRLHPTTRSAGHVVYCLDVMLWIIRLLDIFSVSKHMGPYVVMIGRMTVDMLYFLLIMVVFLLAYGVAQQAILYPNEGPSWSVVSGVFFRPYFQVYGELFVEAPDTISNTTTLFGTSRKDEHGDTIVAFIVAFYLLVANILLLNLLIAIFNNTYNSVQANANQIWKFQRYYLVMEYAQRPVLVPPFIILNHVIHLIKGLYRWLRNCCRRRKNRDQVDCTHCYGLKLFLEKDDLQKLSMFEERCVDGYLREKDTLLHATQEEKIKVIGERMESVSCQLQDMYKETITQSNLNKKSISSLDSRLTRLEEHTHRIVGLLERLPVLLPPETGLITGSDENEQSRRTVSLSDVEITGHRPVSLRLSNEGAKTGSVSWAGGRLKSLSESEQSSSTNQKELEEFTRSRLSTAAQRARKKSIAKQVPREKTTHVQARQSPYPESNQQRYPVPDFLVDWQESFPGYDPPLYTAPEVQALPPWADADILDPSNTSVAIIFNCTDKGINRRSHTGMFDVVGGLPRNPVGRTGVAGRGLLGRWGPNHAAHLIVTRWKRGKDREILQKEGKNVLEFVAIKSLNKSELEIPGGPVEVGDSVSGTLKKSFNEKVLPALKPAIAEERGSLEELVHTMILDSVEVYKGYVDDLRNTDNAWMETVTMNFHDETGEILGNFEFEVEADACGVNWQEVSGHINLRNHQSFVLHKVAEVRNAYF